MGFYHVGGLPAHNDPMATGPVVNAISCAAKLSPAVPNVRGQLGSWRLAVPDRDAEHVGRALHAAERARRTTTTTTNANLLVVGGAATATGKGAAPDSLQSW